jgi:hypothetical protein
VRRVLACLLALALGAACALLVACGGDGKGLIGSNDADRDDTAHHGADDATGH